VARAARRRRRQEREIRLLDSRIGPTFWRALLAGAVLALAACSGSSRGQDAFCSRLQRDRDSLITGVVDAKTAEAAAKRYAALDGLAPEAIRVEWHQLTELVQTAADLDPASTDERTALVNQAYSSAPAAARVTQYAQATCGVTLAPPAVATPTTTAAPAPAPSAPAETAPAETAPPPSG
jgi:hypothetical protein